MAKQGLIRGGTPSLSVEDRKLLDLLQRDFPLVPHPFEILAQRMGWSQKQVIDHIGDLKQRGVIRQIRGLFDSRQLGYHSTLVAVSVAPAELNAVADRVSQHPGVSHNYSRDHDYNLWFTLTLPMEESLAAMVESLVSGPEVEKVLLLPALRVFKIDARFDLLGDAIERQNPPQSPFEKGGFRGISDSPHAVPVLSNLEKACVVQLQKDLPLGETPFDAIVESAGLPVSRFLEIARRFLDNGVLRRYGAVINHRRAGYVANAMGCWIVPPSRIEEVGKIMASFSAVTHCYERPTFTDWPYNLFTMIHGRTREECEAVAAEMAHKTVMEEHRLLYSSKEYKKESVKYFI